MPQNIFIQLIVDYGVGDPSFGVVVQTFARPTFTTWKEFGKPGGENKFEYRLSLI